MLNIIKKQFCKILFYAYKAVIYFFEGIISYIIKQQLGYAGKNIMLKPFSSVYKGLENFYFLGDIRIARNAVIYSTNAKLIIGNKVEIAPNLKIITGNHNYSSIGHFMFDGNYVKRKEDDKDVIIEGDNWLGINVTILSGVTIGRGSIIAAGAVVTKPMPRYCIIGGCPGKVIKFRFSIDEILKHEEKLYPIEKRMTREQLLYEREHLTPYDNGLNLVIDPYNNINNINA